jgi:hypothetical protein
VNLTNRIGSYAQLWHMGAVAPTIFKKKKKLKERGLLALLKISVFFIFNHSKAFY